MYLAILMTAAALAAPLPEGRGGARLMPLAVTADVPGAVASIRYRDTRGREAQASCVAPCALRIPRAAPFILAVDKDGRALATPRILWGFDGLSGPNLHPSQVNAADPQPAP